MNAFGAIGPAAIAEAKVKSRLAEFLMAEQDLIKLQGSTKGDIRKKAAELYTEHMNLDKAREKALAEVENIKSGFSFTSTAIIIKFARDMEVHIDEVNDLKAKAAGTLPLSKGFKIPWVKVGMALVAYKVIRIFI